MIANSLLSGNILSIEPGTTIDPVEGKWGCREPVDNAPVDVVITVRLVPVSDVAPASPHVVDRDAERRHADRALGMIYGSYGLPN